MLRTWLDNITMIVSDNVTSNGVDCFKPNARVYIGEDVCSRCVTLMQEIIMRYLIWKRKKF